MNRLLNKILIVFVIFTCAKPEGIANINPLIDKVLYYYAYILGVAIIAALFLIQAMKRRNISAPVVVILAFIFYMVVNTAIHNGPLDHCINMWIKAITILCVFEVYRNSIVDVMRSLEFVLLVLILINLYYMIYYPDGMYTNESGYTACWFLGYKSSFQYYFLPLLMIATLFLYYRQEIALFLVIAIAIHVETILGWNVMLLITLFVYDVFLLFGVIHKTNIFNMNLYSILIVGLNIVVVFFFTIIFNMPFVYYIFNTVLGKNRTLLIRFDMWQTGLEYITKNLLFGYGYTTGTEMRSWFGIGQAHLHNQALMLLLQTGLIGTTVFFAFIMIVRKSLNDNRNLFSSKIISLTIFCLLLAVVVEVFMTGNASATWPIFFMGFYTKRVDGELRNKSKKIQKYLLENINES